MKIIEAINEVDSLKPNTYSRSQKVAWLSRVDTMIKKHIIDTHEGAEAVSFSGYDDKTSVETVLLVPAPYDDLYLRWLEAQIDYYNGEYDKYNNSIEMYNTAFQSYQNHYNRTHTPIGAQFKYF